MKIPQGRGGRTIVQRRRFLTAAAVGFAGVCLPLPSLGRSTVTGKLRLGVITDVHQDVMHDGVERLAAFIQSARDAEVDFIVQLGDFCQPHERNRPFLEAWDQFAGPRYHVLGNHDMDGGRGRDHTVEFYGMPSRYYSFDRGGIRFIVLDGNDPGGATGGYARHVASEQQAWLDGRLAACALPVIVLIHQPLESSGGVDNREAVRAVLEKSRGESCPGVVACLSGHLHRDYVRPINGIAHVQINSASYVWLPAKARRQVYREALHQAHPYLDHVAPYRDPLWAIVTVDHDAGTLAVQGRSSAWVGPDPWERGASESDYPRDRNRPAISHWSGPLFSSLPRGDR
jgi:3',5'-cyclic-AMP phosphodiesterase